MIIRREDKWWILWIGDEELCRIWDVEFDEAIDAFAANLPHLADKLDEFKCGEFCGNGVKPEKKTRGGLKRGSGARFRELILAGKTNAECLEIVRAEFPESKATLSDAAWNRAALRKGKF